LNNEKLGQGEFTDVLTVSFSSTDYIGHQYGPHAPEIKDTYIRLDKDIAELLKRIDTEVGFENVVVFITADHGVVSEPHELLERNIPAGYFDASIMKTELLTYLNTIYGEGDWIKNYSNNNLFLNHELLLNQNINLEEIQRNCAQFFLKYEWVKNTYTATQLNENEYQNSFHSLVQRGYNQKRSGDVIVSLQTGWLSKYWEKGGTTHGSSYSYDTHVPLIFWGGTIPQGQTDRKVNIRDIAPTISTILGTAYPNGCTGNPLSEVTQ
jgi:predicted AlkP superfamily pyrophosphatase or phosphodiesterase